MRSLAPLFRFLLRLQGAIVIGARIDRKRDRLIIDVRRHSNAKPRCPRCARVMGGAHKKKKHSWRHFDVLRIRCDLAAEIREARCPKHGRMVESVPWAQGRAKHTIEFDRHVTSLVQVADKSAAARMFKISWRTVGRMVTRVVNRCLPTDLLDGLVAISVDETSYRRKHQYLTVVTDAFTGRVVWVHEGKNAETFGRFFEELGPKRREELEVVCMDMSAAYRAAVETWVPHVDVVYDRFHVVKLLLEAIDEVRREECRKAGGIAGHPLKKTRYALLRNPKHRTPKDDEAIARIKRSNGRLYRAYELRESFEDLWDFTDETEAKVFLMRWTRSALLSRRPALRRFARTVRKHIDGVLGFVRQGGMTNALAEGTNNKIKLAIHRAFGFRSLDALVAMVHLCCSGVCVSE